MKATTTRRLLGAISLVGATALLASCAGGGDASGPAEDTGSLADMEPVVLTVSDVNPDSASNAVALTEWMDHVTEATDGKVTFDTYFTGTLHSGPEGLEALEQNLTDITFYIPGWFPNELPVSNWISPNFASEANAGFPQSSLANSIAINVLQEETPEIKEELAAYNAQPFIAWGSDTIDMLCTSPVNSLDSAKGKIVNTSGEPWSSEASAIGMTPELIDIPEEYEAMQRGVLDCMTSNPSPMMTRGTWEIAKFYTPVQFSPALGPGYLFNKETWDSLPLEVQQIMYDSKSIIIGGFQATAHERFAEFAEQAPDMGVEFQDPAELNEELAAYNAELASEVIERAPAEATDPQATFDAFIAAMDESVGLVVNDLGVEEVELTSENIIERYLSMRDIDWDGYKTLLQDSLSQYRPE